MFICVSHFAQLTLRRRHVMSQMLQSTPVHQNILEYGDQNGQHENVGQNDLGSNDGRRERVNGLTERHHRRVQKRVRLIRGEVTVAEVQLTLVAYRTDNIQRRRCVVAYIAECCRFQDLELLRHSVNVYFDNENHRSFLALLQRP